MDRNNKRHIKSKGKNNKRDILWGRVILVVIVFLLIVCGIGYGGITAYNHYILKTNGEETSVTTEKEGSTNVKKEETYKTEPFQQEAIDRPMYILLLGIDEKKDNNLNSVYLVSVNAKQKNIDIIGVPTHSKIVGRENKTIQPLEVMFREGGLPLTKAVVEDIFHIPIPFFIMFNEDSFRKTYNVLGPIHLYVEKDMTTYNEDGSSSVLTEGYQHMDDAKAWSYVAFTDSLNGGADGVLRQERFIKALIEKNTEAFTFTRAINVLRYWTSLKTNISLWDAFKFSMESGKFKKENFNYNLLPGTTERNAQAVYWDIDPIAAQELIGLTMNPKGDKNDE